MIASFNIQTEPLLLCKVILYYMFASVGLCPDSVDWRMNGILYKRTYAWRYCFCSWI